MVDSSIVAKWNNKEVEVIITETFDDFKLNCQSAFNFTQNQMKELKMKYKDPDEEDDDDAMIVIEEESDYQGLLDSDISQSYILLNTIIDQGKGQGQDQDQGKDKCEAQTFKSTMSQNPNQSQNQYLYQSQASFNNSQISPEQMNELKMSIIEIKQESLLNIKEMNNESIKSITELKEESKQSMIDMKEELIEEIQSMFKSQQVNIITQLNEKIQKLEKQQQVMQSQLLTQIEQQQQQQEKQQQQQFMVKTEQSSTVKEPVKPLITHEDIECSECNEFSFAGNRYKCHSCPNYNLCQNCFDTIDHAHLLYVIKDSTKMPIEVKSKKVIRKVKKNAFDDNNNSNIDLRNTTKPKVNLGISSPMKEFNKTSPQVTNSFENPKTSLNTSGLKKSSNANSKNDSFKQVKKENETINEYNKVNEQKDNYNKDNNNDKGNESDDDIVIKDIPENKVKTNNSGFDNNSNDPSNNQPEQEKEEKKEQEEKEEVYDLKYEKLFDELDDGFNISMGRDKKVLMRIIKKHEGDLDEIKKELGI